MYPSYDLLIQLLAAAVQISGLPPIHVSELPPVVVMSRAEINDTVCAGNAARCNSLVAAFDTKSYRIVVNDVLDLNDAADNSFLVHEIVHVLQFKHTGSARFASCRGVISSEHEAYMVQNTYLRMNGRNGGQGSSLRFARCPAEEDGEKANDMQNIAQPAQPAQPLAPQ